MSDYPKLNKKLRIMEELKGEKPKRRKKKINLQIDTPNLDIEIKREEGEKVEFKVDSDIIDVEKTEEGTKITVEKEGIATLILKLLRLKK